MYTQEAFMLFSDLTVLHEHQQMNMRKDFVHKTFGFTGRFHPRVAYALRVAVSHRSAVDVVRIVCT